MISLSIEAEVTCDRCNHTVLLDYDDVVSEESVTEDVEAKGWGIRDNELLCPQCFKNTAGEDNFIDRCQSCIRHMGYYCPHYKKMCEDVRC